MFSDKRFTGTVSSRRESIPRVLKMDVKLVAVAC